MTRELNSIIQKGYNALELLNFPLVLLFAGISSVRFLYYSGLAWMGDAHQDFYYCLKNDEKMYWQKILGLFGRRVRPIVEENGEEPEGTYCMIFDDSFLEKTSNSTEVVSRVFDHVSLNHIRGYKLLLMGWWDGKSFVPVDFSFHREG